MTRRAIFFPFQLLHSMVDVHGGIEIKVKYDISRSIKIIICVHITFPIDFHKCAVIQTIFREQRIKPFFETACSVVMFNVFILAPKTKKWYYTKVVIF